jgi:RNA polymerase sigma-70 factor (ECF subfamily)
MHSEELAALLARSQSGDPAAFDQLVARVQGPLSRYLAHLVGDRELAEDLTQDTLLELYQRRGADEVGLVAAWLYRAATNNALSALRRRHRFHWLPLDWLRGQPARGPQLEATIAERQAVQQALARIPRDQAACLLLHDAVGFKCAEIAGQQGISLAAAKQRLARARRAFLAAYTGPLPAPDRPHPPEKEDLSYVP